MVVRHNLLKLEILEVLRVQGALLLLRRSSAELKVGIGCRTDEASAKGSDSDPVRRLARTSWRSRVPPRGLTNLCNYKDAIVMESGARRTTERAARMNDMDDGREREFAQLDPCPPFFPCDPLASYCQCGPINSHNSPIIRWIMSSAHSGPGCCGRERKEVTRVYRGYR